MKTSVSCGQGGAPCARVTGSQERGGVGEAGTLSAWTLGSEGVRGLSRPSLLAPRPRGTHEDWKAEGAPGRLWPLGSGREDAGGRGCGRSGGQGEAPFRLQRPPQLPPQQPPKRPLRASLSAAPPEPREPAGVAGPAPESLRAAAPRHPAEPPGAAGPPPARSRAPPLPASGGFRVALPRPSGHSRRLGAPRPFCRALVPASTLGSEPGLSPRGAAPCGHSL